MDSKNFNHAATPAQRIALERAEALFERRGISEIREIEKATLKQIDEKKTQLRDIVGESYKDVISSADAIVHMASHSQTIVKNVSSIQERFNQARVRVSSGPGEGSKDARKAGQNRRDGLHAVGSRVKYLVDSPELIWSCLDSGDYLEASRRLLRAQAVYDVLQNQAPKILLSKFPLLQHLWPNVEKLRSQVVEQIRQYLCTAMPLPGQKAAACLASLASLEALGTSEVLHTFLESRKRFINQQLNSPSQSVFSELATTVQDVIAQVGSLFMSEAKPGKKMDRTSSSLQEIMATDDVGYTGLLFGAFSVKRGDSVGSQSEAEVWASVLEGFRGKLEPVNPGTAAEKCEEWLKSVAETVLDSSSELLRSCQDLQELSKMESDVKEVVGQWVESQETDLDGEQNGITSNAERLDESVTWEDVIEKSMGLKVTVWDDVFEQPFRRRALELVEAAFDKLTRDVQLDLDENLEDMKNSVPEALGGVRSTIWSDAQDIAKCLTEPSLVLSSPRKRALLYQQSGLSDSHARVDSKARARKIAKAFDDGLGQALTGVVEMLDQKHGSQVDEDPTGESTAVSLSSRASGRLSSMEKSARCLDLEPKIQAKCEIAVQRLSVELGARVEKLSGDGSELSRDVECALLIGSLCLEVSESCSNLAAFVSSPEDWRNKLSTARSVKSARTPATSFFTPRSARARLEPVPENLQRIKDQFHLVGLRGFQVWATWAASGLAERLTKMLEGDAVLEASEAPPSWDRIVMSHEDEVGKSVEEMQFCLPSCPSSPMLNTLLASCWELKRVGGNAVPSNVLQLYEWQLGMAVCQSLDSALGASGVLPDKLKDNGVLQLLFDVRFVRDVLSGGRPLSAVGKAQEETAGLTTRGSARAFFSRGSGSLPRSGSLQVDSATASALSERKQKFSSLESRLSDRLDPIDWATYEPHLWQIQQRYYNRTAVLFGALTQLNPLYAEVSIKLPQNAETNVLNLEPTVPRFQYLPIRATPMHQRKSSQLPIAQAALEAIVNNSALVDPAGSYSFADLGSRKASAVDGDQSGASSAFSSIQAKLGTGSLGSLGMMLGDKAAEVTSLAQQRFEQLGDFSNLSSGFLSSFSFKSMGKTAGQSSS